MSSYFDQGTVFEDFMQIFNCNQAMFLKAT